MMRLSKEKAFNYNLPKWPQLLLTGKKVTIEQAKDIIFKTDSFVCNPSSYGGGNNRHWTAAANKQLGYDKILQFEDIYLEKKLFSMYYDIIDKMRAKAGFIDYAYLRNSWASSVYIYGPYGWCHPDGIIEFSHNVGKWPSVEEIYKELKVLAVNFPYLEITATLMNDEYSVIPPASPVITMVLKDQKIFFTDQHKKYHYTNKQPRKGVRNITDTSTEQGLQWSWIEEFGERLKPFIDEALLELQDSLVK